MGAGTAVTSGLIVNPERLNRRDQFCTFSDFCATTTSEKWWRLWRNPPPAFRGRRLRGTVAGDLRTVRVSLRICAEPRHYCLPRRHYGWLRDASPPTGGTG